jgi:hypothetical protein
VVAGATATYTDVDGDHVTIKVTGFLPGGGNLHTAPRGWLPV